MAYDEDEGDQKRANRKLAAAIKSMQIEQQKKELMKQLLDSKAYERLMNIRISNPELYSQMVKVVVSLAQTNRLQGKMTEPQLLSILGKVTVRKEPTINFKRK
ncbi:MAG: DNA-binding protein [Candidatus Marsarchaeota archaeon]|jgi:DNA-binding TFAR19-related protein (PDSD5 family)|nr:DNA-binding protein [Candidatus Marsarchaeota archaeon]MCL5111376.1 DNA-binding protein [Candidatus Marsarchaeota archaeon]